MKVRRFIKKTTNQVLTTTLSPIPSHGALDNRYALVIYNDSPDTAIFIGESDVTIANGLMVPSLSHSSIQGAGPKISIYGLTSSDTANIRAREFGMS